MTAKGYLRDARKMKIAINGKIERMDQLRSIATSVTPQISDMPKSTGNPQRMAHIVEEILDFGQEIAVDTLSLVKMQRKIQTTINMIDKQDYRTVLELYYLNGYSWNEVAEKMSYSPRQIYRIHGEALHEYERWQ